MLTKGEVWVGSLALVLCAVTFAADTFGDLGMPVAGFYVVSLVLAAQVLVGRWFLFAAVTVASLTVISAIYNQAFASGAGYLQILIALTLLVATAFLLLWHKLAQPSERPPSRGKSQFENRTD